MVTGLLVGLGTKLLSEGVSWFGDKVAEHGEELVMEGIKKTTGIDLSKKKSLAEITPEEQKAILDAELEIRQLDFATLQLELDARQKEETEKTKRWESDNNSDSRIAKLVRPLTMIYLIIVCTLLAILDKNISGFEIQAHWVTLFTTLTITVVGGYFTLRTYEKRTGTSTWKSS